MLYGGPLGTYLSGYHGPGAVKSKSSTPPIYSTGTTSGSGGLTRSRSTRYRAPSAYSGVSGITSTTVPSRSSFYTPQIRRKYSDESLDTTGRSRYTNSGTGDGVGSNSTSYYSARPSPTPNYSGTNSASTVVSIPRRSASYIASDPFYGHDTSGCSIDYKRLYEAEKMESTELRNSITKAQNEVRDLRNQIEEARKSHHPGNPEQRKFERHLSEYEEQMKELEQLRSDAEKFKAEHRALMRVVSRYM